MWKYVVGRSLEHQNRRGYQLLTCNGGGGPRTSLTKLPPITFATGPCLWVPHFNPPSPAHRVRALLCVYCSPWIDHHWEDDARDVTSTEHQPLDLQGSMVRLGDPAGGHSETIHQPPTGLVGRPTTPQAESTGSNRAQDTLYTLPCPPTGLRLTVIGEDKIERKKKVCLEMAANQEAGRHQEVGHKSLLQSDALYQVSLLPRQQSSSSSVFFFFPLSSDSFCFGCFCSIYLKPVFTQKSLNPWRSSGSWLPSIHGELSLLQILQSLNNHFVYDPCFCNLGIGTKTKQEHHDYIRWRGAVPEHASQAHQCQEHHGDRRLHWLLSPGHGPCSSRWRKGRKINTDQHINH